MKTSLQLGKFAMVGLGLVVVTLLGFLYVRTQAYDATSYFENVSLLRQIKQLDARRELNTLKSKIGLNRSYDPLVDPLRKLERLHTQVDGLGTLQLSDDTTDWGVGLAAYQEATEEKTTLIERFKSHNAVLRNSLAFLPTAADDIQQLISQARGGDRQTLEGLSVEVNSLLLSSLVYSQAAADDQAAQIAAALDRLATNAAPLPAAIAEGLEIFDAHVRTLLREQGLVNRLLNDIAAVPVAARIDDLENLLGHHQQQAAAQAQRYRQYLLLLSTVLAGLLLYVASRLVRSYAEINRVNQQLQAANEGLEQRVQARTRELQEAQGRLLDAARQSGMAEIATNVLHNVGNVLNSVNISADLAMRQVRASKAQGLTKAMQLINQHPSDLGDFLTHDDKGKLLPGYLNQLVEALQAEQRGILDELEHLTDSINHIKEIVATQQAYAGTSSLVEPLRVGDLIEDALRMNSGALSLHQIQVVKAFAEVPLLLLDKHRLLLILINLIGNAKHAMAELAEQARTLTLSVAVADGDRLRIGVKDEGEGIAPENLTRIFAHGFTTRQNGHGFGLHSCAVAAMEMGGSLTAHSDGPGKGALFTLELPCKAMEGTP
jgi:signal transduction histidine kinase